MANVLHRTTLQYLTSVNTPDYLNDNWIINPDLSSLVGVPTKYWKITYNSACLLYSVTEMSQEEKDIVDGSLLAPYKVAQKLALGELIKNFIESKFSPEEQRTLFYLISEAKADGNTNRLAYLAPYWTWVRNAITFKHNKNTLIDNATTLAEVDTICNLNWSALEASVPDVKIKNALAIID